MFNPKPYIELEEIDTTTFYPILDRQFIKGKGTGGTDPIKFPGGDWYPSMFAQRDSVSQIVNCGPYVPKYNETKQSTWQLNYFYNFYFKWGGSYPPDATAANPQTKPTYDVPDNQQETLQIVNPIKQDYNTIFKPWDYRRGSITKTAFKRMFQHLETADSISTDSSSCSSPPRKRKSTTSPRPKRRKQENPSMSPLTLRRAYMPRPNGGKPTPPHPATAPAAAANQAQPPAPHLKT